MSIYKEPPPGMFVVPDPQDMTKVKTQAVIYVVSLFNRVLEFSSLNDANTKFSIYLFLFYSYIIIVRG